MSTDVKHVVADIFVLQYSVKNIANMDMNIMLMVAKFVNANQDQFVQQLPACIRNVLMAENI
jgi:hypothetical protein